MSLKFIHVTCYMVSMKLISNAVARQNLSVVKYFPLDTLLCSTENETCRFGVSMER